MLEQSYDDSLNNVFAMANIELVEQTKHDTVYLECTIRRTGARIFVEGDDLDDAVDKALRQIEDQTWTIDMILEDYDLSLDELRAMVDFEPKLNEPPFVPPITQEPLRLVAAAQPFIARGPDGSIFLALEVLPPDRLDPNTVDELVHEGSGCADC